MLLFVLLINLMQTNPAPDLAGEWSKMRPISPQLYHCPRAAHSIMIDGKLDDPAWQAARWTNNFVDIEGSSKPAPRFRTRAKMLWDDEYLYVAAELEEPHLVATLTEKNSVIFENNDFEIFIDPDGDNHNYYELEMNAFNTIWELTLPKPYKDRGEPKLGTNLPGLKSAVAIDGTINDPSDTDRRWTLEVAMPWKALATYNAGRATPPEHGDVWRMNFSRVQWIYDVVDGKYVRRPRETDPENNWVWSPQGIIDMHRPERWGYVEFRFAEGLNPPRFLQSTPDIADTERELLMEIYHRQRVFHQANGKWATQLSDLDIEDRRIKMVPVDDGFIATVEFIARDKKRYLLHVRQDSRLWWEVET